MIREHLKKIKGLLKISLQDMWAYKLDFLMWAIVTPLSLAVYYFIWRAIFDNSGQLAIRGFTFEQMVGYYVISAVVGIFCSSNNIDKELANRIKQGNLVADIIRPMSIYWKMFWERAGHAIFSIPMFMIPIVLFAVFFFDLQLGSSAHITFFAIATLLALPLNFAMVYIFGTIAFWLKEYRGLWLVRIGVYSFLSGMILPLTFFPQWFQTVANYLPFQYVRYSIVQIALGNFSVLKSISVIAIQLIWIVVLMLLINWITKRGLRKFSGAGS